MAPICNRLLSAALALSFAFALTASMTTSADAHSRRGVAAGVAAGIIGLGILGAAAEARAHRHDDYYYEGDRCYPGPEECGYRRGGCYETEYGEEVCRRGRYTCWRPTICD